jgi:hypothetical protein
MSAKEIKLDNIWDLEVALGSFTPDLIDEFILSFAEGEYKRTISMDEYLDELYVERKEEKFEIDLKKEAPIAPRILCVAGERGSGKTSALEFVRKKLSESDPDLLFIRLDLKELYDVFFTTLLKNAAKERVSVEEQYESAIRELIKLHLISSLFNEASSYRELVVWACAGPPDDTDKFNGNLVLEFMTTYRLAALRAKCETDDRTTRKKKIRTLFLRNPEFYQECMLEIDKVVRSPHIINAYLSVYKSKSRILIVIDNIDRIRVEFQKYFLIACRDLRMNMGTYGSITVAIRIENIKEKIPRIPGDDHFFDFIMPDNQKYSGLLLKPIMAEHMEEVLRKRDTFTKKIIGEYDKKNRSDILQKHGEEVSNILNSIVKDFVENAVYALANDSYIVLLKVYVEFMRYIATLKNYNYFSYDQLSREKEDRHLQTLFYIWLQENGPNVGIPLHNIIDYKDNSDSLKVEDIGSAQHILLTCIYNLTKENASKELKGVYPQWKTVVSRMYWLGFSYNKIIEALRTFLTPLESPPGAVCFVSREVSYEEIIVPTSQKDSYGISDNCEDQIKLTSMGHELVRNVLHKAGYIWGIAYRSEEIRIPKKDYTSFSRKQKARHVYNFTKILAKRHLKFLYAVAISRKDEEINNWLNRYRREFGIDNHLQVERILSSAGLFFDSLFSRQADNENQKFITNPFKIMGMEYSALVDKIASGIPLEKLNLAELNRGDHLFRNRDGFED